MAGQHRRHPERSWTGRGLPALTRARAKSLAVQEHIRSPLKGFYGALVKKHGFPGPNPAGGLKEYMSKYPTKRFRPGRFTYFKQEEGPQLFATCAAGFPRWLAFIGCCTLAGLRWGVAAALEWERKL